MTLSICCITYNHEKFIAQAIEGFLMQQTNFSFEIVIHDDASTDSTQAIIKSFADAHPGKLRTTLHSTNKGMMPNFIGCLKDCAGKYIALCEGDDCWSDPYKLQKQVDFLEKNRKIVGCYSDTQIVNCKGEMTGDAISESFKNQINIEQVISFWMPTVSVCFRAKYLEKIKMTKGISKVTNGDMFLYFLLTQYGNFAYVQTDPCLYRRHPGGIWSSLKIINQYEKNLKSDYVIYDELMPEFKYVLIKRIRNNYQWQLKYFRNNEHITYIFKFLKNNIPSMIERRLFKELIGLIKSTTAVLFHRIHMKLKRI